MPPVTRSSWFALLGVAALLCSAPVAHAQAPDATRTHARARALFEAGRVAINEGDYDAAYRYFTEAHELSERPRLLFNMAIAAERLRRDSEALELYERYLVELPDAENADYVRSRIDVLLTAQEEIRPPPTAAELAPEPLARSTNLAVPEPPARGSGSPPIAGIVTLAGGAAVAIAGGATLGVAVAERGNVDDAPVGSSWADYRDGYDAANLMAPIGVTLLGLGVATTVVGGIVIATTGEGEDQEVALLPTGSGVMLRGSF